MGRLTFNLARPVGNPQFEWYGLKFGYKGEKSFFVSGTRIFPHTNNISEYISKHGIKEIPENVDKNMTLSRFAKTGTKFQFQFDFTNLNEDELKKLIWALDLESGLAHKMGKSKALYFGSCQINITDAFLIDWEKRFSSFEDQGRYQLDINKYRPSASDLANYNELKKALSLPK